MEISELVCMLLLESALAVTVIEPNGLDDDDLRATHRHRIHMAGSDGVYTRGKPHPRGWGTFARYLGRYGRERGDFSWEAGVQHLATAAAERFGLRDRGRLAPGMFADLAVIDPERIIDTATFLRPTSTAVGVQHVVVNGVPVLIDGRSTGQRPGRALRR
jgi:N-acyl-D-amino-acid deacylase